MSVGDILDRGLKLLLVRLPTIFFISLLVQLPLLFYQVALPALAERNAAVGALGGLLGTILVSLILAPLATAAILYVIWQEFVDRHVGMGEAFRVGLARFGSILAGSILFSLVLFAGFCMLCIPFFIFLSWFYLYSQVIVVEGLGPVAALSRSKSLTEGYRLRLLGILILLQIIGSILQGALNVVLLILLPLEYVNTPPLGLQPVFSTNLVIHHVLLFPVIVLVAAYTSVCMTLLYFDIRIRKEGFDLELAAQKQPSPLS
jgi:hypothetical protein